MPLVVSACAAPEEAVGTSREQLRSCVNIAAAGDATLSREQTRASLGAKKTLKVGEGDESLIAFDLGAIPVGAVIQTASLKLFVSDADAETPILVHRATASWSEAAVTYSTFAQHFDPAIVGSFEVRRGNVQKSVDLTALVGRWSSGATPNYGVFLETRSREESTLVSREGGTSAQRPALEVCFTTPEDHCAPNPCANAGTCENGPTGFTCHCLPGFAGDTCGMNIDDCAKLPCLNGGGCLDGISEYSCSCAPGYTGANCEVDIDECATSPCEHGGVCIDGVGSYSCQCPAAYGGARCEIVLDDCLGAPCRNGGSCASVQGGYLCTCPPGFTGGNCEVNVDECVGQPCKNGGTCIDGAASFSCVCPPDWGGVTCDVNLNSCAQSPCLNGGACTNGVGTYSCSCSPGFSGANCEVDVDDCASAPCLNAGICVDGMNSYACICAGGFSGPMCATPPTPCCLTGDIADCTNTFFGTRCRLGVLVAGTCQGSVFKTREVCNLIDDDCNGVIDDETPFVTNSACKCPACNPVGSPLPETCNGCDDDCDGVVDDHLVDTGAACGTAAPGCTTGVTYCCQEAVPDVSVCTQSPSVFASNPDRLVCLGANGVVPQGCD